MKKQVKDFLIRHSIDPECFSVDVITEKMLCEMQKGLDGKKSSIAMINSYCSDSFVLNKDEKILVIDAGGTNFRTCLVYFTSSGEPVIEDFKKAKMPGTDKEVSAKEFFRTIASETERLITKADKIGFCFSYPAIILENHDGYATLLSKEIKAPEIIGMHLGENLFREYSSRGIDVSNKKIIILNDTVTTLLAGLCKEDQMSCKGCVGFILGTGTNAAYSEKGTIINEESGGFDFIPGDIDKAFIESTNNPSVQHFEKLISGAYLGPLALKILETAKNEGIISEIPDTFTTKDFGEALEFQSLDRDSMDILNAFIERTAIFVSANLCSSVIKSTYGKDKPCIINADGTTFHKIEILKNMVLEYTQATLEARDIKVKFTQIENSPIIGAAIGALTL